jgi:hypothetical protein
VTEKYYSLGTHTAEQWCEIHNLLCQDGTSENNIPSRACECVDEKIHSPTRGDFLLTHEEAEQLKNDPRIKFINLTISKNRDVFNWTEDDLKMEVPTGERYDRYNSTVRNWQFWANSGAILGSFTEDQPWISSGTSNFSKIDRNPRPHGAGEHVDIICMDNGTWIGHTEFINRNVTNAVNPNGYVGGNVLPGNGYCDVLDVILDGPYYIDPEWFDSDPDNRLETRWDGTIVPTETAAVAWWEQSGQRSAEFSGIGTVFIPSSYTRDGMHGSNSTYPTTASADHGTQCASLIYGRTHGWAYNANKWHLNLYGTGGSDIEAGFDVCKLFHKHKPVNPIYGTQDPTIGSNSWGYRAGKSASFYFFQSATGTAYGGSGDEPEFMAYMGVDGDRGNWKSEMRDNSITAAGDELVESGLIFVAAAGNSGQMQVNPDDPNYDNHIDGSQTDGVYQGFFSEFGLSTTGTTNRRGFPQHIGKTKSESFQGDTEIKFPAINIGALDDAFDSSKERKVNYSDMGNAIDLYAPADGTLAATVGTYGTDVARYDDDYPALSTSSTCRDTRFSGTSAACPVAAGFLATILQYNRNWTYEDLRGWIQSSVEIQDSNDFYDNTRGTTAEGSEWSDRNRLQGGVARVAYLADFPITTPVSSEITGTSLRGTIALRNGLLLRRRQ